MRPVMTEPIKPYKILGVQEYPDGKLIAYEVSRRYLVDESDQRTTVLRTTAFAPLDADIDEFMFNHLKGSEWLM
jgi:hypothetical protein